MTEVRTVFSKGNWILWMSIAWFIGFINILVFSGISESIGIKDTQFVLGLGMGFSIALFQSRLLKNQMDKHWLWIFISAFGMSLPFIINDITDGALKIENSNLNLLLQVMIGALLTSIGQFILLRGNHSKSWLWIVASLLAWTIPTLMLGFIVAYDTQSTGRFTAFFINLFLILGGGPVYGFITAFFMDIILTHKDKNIQSL